ncbi:MAG: YeeE/YedE family protein [Candidatus Promineifilaceae bacterium]
MAIILAVICGVGLGYIIERGDFCFHSTLRGLVRKPPELDLFRAYLLTLLVAVPLVQGMRLLGWIDPWIPPFNLQANLLGGTLFGVGMVTASSCITGLFYKLGHGMLGALVGLAAWALGDLIAYKGPLAGLREGLTAAPLTVNGGETATVLNTAGPGGGVVLLLVGTAVLYYLWRSPQHGRGKYWGWLLLGLATGLMVSAAWLLADIGGTDYPYGTSGVPTEAVEAVLNGGQGSGSLWIPVALVSLIPGSFLAAWRAGTLWVRGETPSRYVQLAAGGLMMGIGAGIAGGCNLGHSLVGVPLLSLGSITSTAAMFLGVALAHGILQAVRRQTAVPQRRTVS